jgi:23S rRNA pseudouridine1911/1915/1917 synthase
VGDTLYGAPRVIPIALRTGEIGHLTEGTGLHLERNFLHAAHLEFAHPRSGKALVIDAPLPAELNDFLARLTTEHAPVG